MMRHLVLARRTVSSVLGYLIQWPSIPTDTAARSGLRVVLATILVFGGLTLPAQSLDPKIASDVNLHLRSKLRLRKIRFLKTTLYGDTVPELLGLIENSGDEVWKGVTVAFEIEGKCPDLGQPSKWAFDVHVGAVLPNANLFVDKQLQYMGKVDGCQYEKVNYATMTGGYVVTGLEAELLTNSTLVARGHLEADVAKEFALTTAPRLDSGLTTAFVGSDRKCVQDFLAAVQLEGVEKRKRLAELIQFRCGFLVPNGTPVSIEVKDQAYAVVKVLNGDDSGKAGFVPVGWIKQPK